MTERPTDPRTEDTITYELVRTLRPSGQSEVVGSVTFKDGRSTVNAPEPVAVAVRELLGRAFVDRVQADERPRGYRRSGQGGVDMLVPGMPEHFMARLRGLWLPYPDGTVVTAREAALGPTRAPALAEVYEPGATVTDPAVRRMTLAESERVLDTRPIVQANPPATGLRPPAERPREVNRTDCGWIA
ncbi:MAG TPA: hypothetical protein VHK63_00250 [Candidatus Limnocylindria bacterium]|nr:hypothetical protein [Candidatus Limnocylindria bacterium]